MNQLKNLTDRSGNAYKSNDTVTRHSGGWAINGNGSHSEASARATLINNAKK